MIPASLDLPARFTDFRPGQWEGALAVHDDPRRFQFVAAPPGVGKSLLALAVARMAGGRALVLTSTKGLQDQYARDFGGAGLVDMRGAGNYECVAVRRGGILAGWEAPGTRCDRAPCRAEVECEYHPKFRNEGCLYYDQRKLASNAEWDVTSYAYWMSIGRWGDPSALGEFDLVIADEGHHAPDALSQFATVELRARRLKDAGSELPDYGDDICAWLSWARDVALPAAKLAYRQAREGQVGTRALLRLQQTGREIRTLTEVADSETEWVIEASEERARFTPVWPKEFAERYLWRGAGKVVVMSASITHATPGRLGIAKDAFGWHDVGGGFPAARRPFYWVNGPVDVRVDYRLSEGGRQMWIGRIDRVIGARLDRKGIVDPVSYARGVEIAERSKYREHMIVCRSGMDTAKAVARFKRASAPAILVSPAIGTGYDFPGDTARYYILAKIPFPDRRDPVMAARSKADRHYPIELTVREIVQRAGRIVRSESDWGEVFLPDDHWRHFRRNEFPAWFKSAWKIGAPSKPLHFDS